MWICPDCGRPFAKKNQSHSCVVQGVEAHFENRDPQLKAAYEKVAKAVATFGPHQITAAKSSIFFKNGGSFAGIKVMKDHLKLEFFLEAEHDEFPIEKTFRYSKNKIVHVMRVGSAKDIDRQVTGWLKESYSLISKKS